MRDRGKLRRKIAGKRHLTVYEARALLEQRLKEEGEGRMKELDGRVMSYLSLFPQKDISEVQKVRESLAELGLPEEIVVNLLNLCPQEEGEIRAIITRPDFSYDPQLVSQIREALKSFCGN